MTAGGRDLALRCLAGMRNMQDRSDEVLDRVISRCEDERERALCARLFYSVLQNRILLDHEIGRFCRVPLSRLEPQVLDILRLCCAQLLLFDRIPAFSAVDEAVRQCSRVSPRASGLVNAVCRKIAAEKERPEIDGTPAERLSVRYSHPLWFTEKMLSVFGSGEECAAYLEANNTIPPVFLRRNLFRPESEERFRDAGLRPFDDAGCYTAEHASGAVKELLDGGLAYVQDPASAYAVLAAGVEPGMTVADVCAAPGGKSFTACMLMKGKGRLFSSDISARKVEAMRAQADRLGLPNMTVCRADAREPRPELEKAADVVLADVPCSGFGVIRKKPEIRYKDPDTIARLPDIGLEILRRVSGFVRPGGILLYSTCTVLPEENEEVVRRFLEEVPEFRLSGFSLPAGECPEGMKTLFPHREGTDGFFICRMQRGVEPF